MEPKRGKKEEKQDQQGLWAGLTLNKRKTLDLRISENWIGQLIPCVILDKLFHLVSLFFLSHVNIN